MGSSPIYYPSLSDKADPTKEIRGVTDYLRKLIHELQVQSWKSGQFITLQDAEQRYSPAILKRLFQSGGPFALNLHDLPGVLAQPQNPGAPKGKSLPSIVSPLAQDGELFILQPANSLWFFDGIARAWAQLTAGAVTGYATIQSGGVALIQRTILNIITTSGLQAADNAGATRSDIGFSNFAANTVLAGPSGGGGAVPTARALVAADILHDILSAAHPDTLAAAVVAGDLIRGNATPKWDRLAAGVAGNVLTMSGGLPTWLAPGGGAPHAILSLTHTDTTAAAPVRGDVIVVDSTVKWVRKPLGAAATYLRSDGTDVNYLAIPAADLPVFGASGASHSKGAVPDPGVAAGTTKFLREDATFAVPVGGGAAGPPLLGRLFALMGG